MCEGNYGKENKKMVSRDNFTCDESRNKSSEYFLQTSRYIHMNPFVANMVKEPSEYIWSSYRTFLGIIDDKLTDVTKTLKYFKNESRILYKDFVESKVEYNQMERQICKELGKDEWLPW